MMNSQARSCFRELFWTSRGVITSSHASGCAALGTSCSTSAVQGAVSGGAGGLEKKEMPESQAGLATLLAVEEWKEFRLLPDKTFEMVKSPRL